ncbi:MAG: sigma-70 family RNA polymerase sigma factor [Mucilaginibacter polytrichastri]|nr:sigma-70 family RNA polymerase sigma factor [Mucilaginibacter polytrichastri]
MERTDTELINAWKTGDERAFEIFYKRHSSRLLYHAIKKTCDITIAEDILQDAYLTFYKCKEKLDQLIIPVAFLTTILNNKLLDHIRKNQAHEKYCNYILHHTPTPEFVDTVEAKDLFDKINDVVHNLPPQCQHVFNLSRNAHLSNKHIAKLLNISENTVEQHIRKALRIIRSALPIVKTIIFLIIR